MFVRPTEKTTCLYITVDALPGFGMNRPALPVTVRALAESTADIRIDGRTVSSDRAPSKAKGQAFQDNPMNWFILVTETTALFRPTSSGEKFCRAILASLTLSPSKTDTCRPGCLN